MKTQGFYLHFAKFDEILRHPKFQPLFKAPGLGLGLLGFSGFFYESWDCKRILAAAGRDSPGETGS